MPEPGAPPVVTRDEDRIDLANRLYRQAKQTPLQGQRLRYTLAAAREVWPLLPAWKGEAMAANPQSWSENRAAEIYNESAALAAETWRQLGASHQSGGDSGFTITLDTETAAMFQGDLAYDELHDASRYSKKKLQEEKHRSGIGGPLVGVIDPSDSREESQPFMPPTGYRMPLTAVWDFGEPQPDAVPTEVTLRMRETSVQQFIELDGEKVALAADLSAPLEALAPQGNDFIMGLLGLLNPLQSKVPTKLLMLQPYDPDRIPVVMVHGLQSVPSMWGDLLNDLESRPEIAKHYQFLVFGYPTGLPIAYNAEQLRIRLNKFTELYKPRDGIVLIGHSMGGLLSRLQVSDSERVLWDSVFGESADALLADVSRDDIVYQALIFDPNPDVNRIIFIATPHRGSELADNWIGRIGRSLVKIPVAGLVLATGSTVLETVFTGNTPSEVASRLNLERETPNSIAGLSPESPFLIGMNKLEIGVPHHSIIGNVKGDRVPLQETSDGVVPYWSSHLDTAESEIVLPGGHGIYKNPDSTEELLRILDLHMKKN